MTDMKKKSSSAFNQVRALKKKFYLKVLFNFLVTFTKKLLKSNFYLKWMTRVVDDSVDSNLLILGGNMGQNWIMNVRGSWKCPCETEEETERWKRERNTIWEIWNMNWYGIYSVSMTDATASAWCSGFWNTVAFPVARFLPSSLPYLYVVLKNPIHSSELVCSDCLGKWTHLPKKKKKKTWFS